MSREGAMADWLRGFRGVGVGRPAASAAFMNACSSGGMVFVVCTGDWDDANAG